MRPGALALAAWIACQAAALAADEPSKTPPATPGKLQDIPLPGGTAPHPPGSGGIEIRERRFWRDAEAGRRALDLEVKIDRIWSQGPETLTRLTLKNTSEYDLDEIDVHCRAVTQEGRELGFQEQSLRTTESEPIRPGYTKEIELTLDRTGAKIGSVSCNARGF
ncbi:MAG: hypothetical protein ACREQ9_13670 [Candidatus Binatia bacterium]